jgi:hypothetical protein
MKTVSTLLALVVAAVTSGCIAPRSTVEKVAPVQGEVKGCYYAGQLFSIGAVKPSMSAVPSEDGGMAMVDDPKTAIPMKCVMQFDGTRTTFAWIAAGGAA